MFVLFFVLAQTCFCVGYPVGIVSGIISLAAPAHIAAYCALSARQAVYLPSMLHSNFLDHTEAIAFQEALQHTSKLLEQPPQCCKIKLIWL